MTRTRKDIVEAIRHGVGVSRQDAGVALETMLKVTKDALIGVGFVAGGAAV